MGSTKKPIHHQTTATKHYEISAELQPRLNPALNKSAEKFADDVLAAVRNAIKPPPGFINLLSISDLKNEKKSLLHLLDNVENKLRNITYDFNKLLGKNADPIGCADTVEELKIKVGEVNLSNKQFPRKESVKQKQKRITEQIAINVLPILNNYGLNTATTAVTDPPRVSQGIKVLQMIGDDINIVRSQRTWQKRISKVKGSEPYISSSAPPIF
jgi:hypothetical protein